jgi:hypothetical protein
MSTSHRCQFCKSCTNEVSNVLRLSLLCIYKTELTCLAPKIRIFELHCKRGISKILARMLALNNALCSTETTCLFIYLETFFIFQNANLQDDLLTSQI